MEDMIISSHDFRALDAGLDHCFIGLKKLPSNSWDYLITGLLKKRR